MNVFKRKHEKASPALILLSLAGGFLLYWLLWTAVERRIFGPGEMFAFFAGGVPDFVKLLALIACMALCVFLGVSETGARLRTRLRAFADKNGMLWLFSLAVTALFLVWAMRVTVVSFLTSDENTLMIRIGEAAERGLSAAAGSYANILFCGMLALLYRLWPGGFWYAWYHLFILTVSLTVIGRCVLLKMRGRSAALGCLLHLFVCGLFMFAFSQLSFTVTPAVAGTAAVALILCRHECGCAGARAASDIGSVVLMLLCYLQRGETGQCLFCFGGLACAYQLAVLLRRREKPWAIISLVLAICFVAGGSAAAHAVTESAAKAVDRTMLYADVIRSNVVDFYIDDMTQEEFDQVGIPRELAIMLRGWYFMDERITTQTLSDLLEVYYSDHPGTTAEALVSDPASYVRTVAGAAAEEPQALWRAACAAALLLAVLAAFARYGRRYWAELLCALFALGGAGLLLVYIAVNGRMPERVFLVVLLPAIVMMLLMALSVPEGAEATDRRAFRVGQAVCCVLFCALCAVCVYHVPHVTEYADRETVFADQMAIEGCAKARPEIIYITNIYDSYPDPFHAPTYPENLVRWGDVGAFGADGDRLYTDAFFREDVRFMCENPGNLMFLLQYMTLDHGPVSARVEDRITPNIFVYDIDPTAPESGEGWYERNGLRYYFSDGRAAAGERQIGGETFVFAPAGAESPMVMFTDDTDTYYTTTAYSLVENR